MKLWVAGLSLLVAINGCLACSCMGKQTATDKYCDADFVMRVRVMSSLVNPDGDINTHDAFYPVQVLQTYKAPFGYRSGQWELVFTAGNGALCGMAGLKQGVYILAGSITDGKMRLSLCSSIVARQPFYPGSAFTQELKDILIHPPMCSVYPPPPPPPPFI